jgi:hypothetical protein
VDFNERRAIGLACIQRSDRPETNMSATVATSRPRLHMHPVVASVTRSTYAAISCTVLRSARGAHRSYSCLQTGMLISKARTGSRPNRTSRLRDFVRSPQTPPAISPERVNWLHRTCGVTQLQMRWMWTGLVLSVLTWLGCDGDAAVRPPSGSDSSEFAPCRASSTPTALASASIGGAAISGEQILFVDDALETIPFSGGTPQAIAAGGADMLGLTVVGDAAYFTAERPVRGADVALFMASISSGDLTWVADSFISTYSVTDARSAYFSGFGLGSVVKFTPPSATPTMLDAGNVSTRGLAVHGGDLYVAGIDYGAGNGMAGIIVRLSKNGGTATALLHLAGLPLGVAVDDQAIYWIEQSPYGTFDTAHISRADLDGRHEQVLAKVDAGELVLDREYVYFLSESLNRVPKAGGAIELLVSGLDGPGLLQISGSDAIWVNLFNRSKSETRPSTLSVMCLYP